MRQIEKLAYYDANNLNFRRAVIRELLVSNVSQRESLRAERAEIAEALKTAERVTHSALRFVNENPRFRKAYVSSRLEMLKREREELIVERDRIDAELAPNPARRAQHVDGAHAGI